MGIFNKTKKDDETEEVKTEAQTAETAVAKKKPAKKADSVEQITGVLLRPIITERTSAMAAHNQYAFEAIKSANKIQIAKAVLSKFGIKPIRVNVSVHAGKVVRHGRTYGRRPSWKKAIVTLPEGKSINIYEGQVK